MLQKNDAGSIPAASTILTSKEFQKHLIGLEIKAFFIYPSSNKIH